jgi:glycolate oxidase iron-sulfur subunit
MSLKADLTKAADQCVMCGLCLPHCPTYQVSQHEAESPRGRISLVKAFSDGQLTASTSLETHLQSCTGCLKCQQVCPANVSYQYIIDNGRQLYRRKLKYSAQLYQKVSMAVMTHQWGHRLLYLMSCMAKQVPTKNRFVRLLKLINKSDNVSNITDSQHSITVLPGCTSSLFDQNTLTSIVKLLNQLNIRTTIPVLRRTCPAQRASSASTNTNEDH